MRLTARVAFGALAFVVPVGSVTAIAGSCSPEGVLGARLLEGTAPIQVCAATGKETLRSIEAGEKRLVLVLSEYKPSEAGRQSLSVTTPGGHDQVLGVFPAHAFSREATDLHRRFLLASPPNAADLDPTAPICVSVKLAAPDAGARVQLETWTPEK